MAARRPLASYSRESDARRRNDRLTVPRAGYVVSYLQASRERGVEKGFGKGLCVNNNCTSGQQDWMDEEGSTNRLERAQELEKGFLIGGLELLEFVGDMLRFAAMAENGVEERDGSAVMHETGVQANAPERGGADFAGGNCEFGGGEGFSGDAIHGLAVVLGHGLGDNVAGAGGVVGFRDGIAEIGDFIGLKAIGDAHFVEISIAGEGQKAGVLVFPAETADSGLTRRFDDGNIKHLATNLVVAFLALVLGEVDKSLIGDGFHKSIAENVEGNAEGANLFRVRNALLNFGAGEGGIRANGAVVDERATFDDFGSTSNGDFAIYELPVRTAVTNAQS